jgi:hypothetical protein
LFVTGGLGLGRSLLVAGPERGIDASTLPHILLISILQIVIVIVIVLLVRPALFVPHLVVSTVDPPTIIDHQLKILIIVNASGNEVVVVPELLLGDHAVLDAPDVTVLFECSHEVPQHLLFGLFAIDVVRMLVH